ncbi:MAG: LacI family DNA-binding transcriptional regulator [Amaricoccus sp.]
MPGSVVRLKDIAARTGFSVNTVSLALRDSERIPDETRKRIREAAAELDYLPNFVAKSLVSRETKTIGLVLTDVTNPVLTRVAQAVERRLAERGYGTLLGASNGDGGEESRVLEMFRSRQVDGMLVYPHGHRALDAVRRLRDGGLPVVLLAGDRDCGLDVVGTDERRGGAKAVRHLVARGHRRIAMLDSSGPRGNGEKRAGYAQALAEAGIDFDATLVLDPGGSSVGQGCVACARLLALPEPPTALFADNDSLALGALRACKLAGVAVPGDLAIVGFDNIEFAEYATTPLSSVNYAVRTVAHRAVDRLLELIAGGDPLPEPMVTMIDPALVERESTLGAGPREIGLPLAMKAPLGVP